MTKGKIITIVVIAAILIAVGAVIAVPMILNAGSNTDSENGIENLPDQTPDDLPNEEERVFRSVWQTNFTSKGSSNENQVRLPLDIYGSYNFSVSWGDGTNDIITSWSQEAITHTYDTEGIYEINITGTIIGWGFNNDGDKLKLIGIQEWGCLQLGNSGGYFFGCSNLIINAEDILDLTGTTSFMSAFRECSVLSNVPNINLWNTSEVTNMVATFYCAYDFNQSINNWDVSKVTNMRGMFWDAVSFDQDLGGWNVSSVADMDLMFSGITLSVDNYDNLLNGWANLPSVQVDVVFDAGNSLFSSMAQKSFDKLINLYNWDISDGSHP